ncbi:acyl-CoA thioesterase [Fibrobacter sp.]|uniref:acyl-CoA thioesterase n=1 Tax=Fibrobacter sp. TaxID=35828 RepID=UPI0025C4AEB5|nr:acyl-CoA thioesterase [Fibrobacter sp.]MBR3073122.1 acyl-CoA thioesterase [Fibrobacter sp.]
MAVKKLKASVEFRIEFYDIDSMQVAYHGNYVKFMEVARCALLQKIGYGYNEMTKSGYVWPVVDLHIKYIRPMIFMQKVRAEVTLEEYEVCMKLSYKFKDADTGVLLTKAESTQMAVDLNTKESLWACPSCFTDLVRELLAKES